MGQGYHPSIHAQDSPDRPACIVASTGEITTYASLEAASNRVAQWFRRCGLVAGDTVVLFCQNCPEFYEIVWGAQRAGLYFTPVSWHSTAQEIAYIVENSGAKAFFASARFARVAGQAKAIIDPAIPSMSIGGAIAGFSPLEDECNDLPASPIDNQTAGREMLYTSGTTGKPKGVKFSLSETAIEVAPPGDLFYQQEGYGPDARVLAPGPAYHASPLLATMAAHRFGATVVIVDKFDAAELLDFIQTYQVTHLACVPAHFVRLLKLPEALRAQSDVSSVRWIVHTAAPCPVDVKRQMIDWFGPIIVEVYSGTERVGGSLIRCDDWLAHPGSIGKAPNDSAHVVDEATWEEVPRGETGVIYFEHAQEFAYHGDEEKTRGARSPQGWMTLGDIGRIDHDGFIYLTDRKSNMIISGGVNVYPQESEDRLIAHPKVYDVAVFGIPNESFGEEVKAVVQLMPGIEPDEGLEAELIDHCKAALSPLKCPRSIDFMNRLPREANGKLYKQKLVELYQQ